MIEQVVFIVPITQFLYSTKSKSFINFLRKFNLRVIESPAHLFANKTIMPNFDDDTDDTADILKNSKTMLINGKKALVYEKPINPKDYKTYDEYLEAIKIREEFFERVAAVDKIIEESKTEKEYKRRIAELGFTS